MLKRGDLKSNRGSFVAALLRMTTRGGNDAVHSESPDLEQPQSFMARLHPPVEIVLFHPSCAWMGHLRSVPGLEFSGQILRCARRDDNSGLILERWRYELESVSLCL